MATMPVVAGVDGSEESLRAVLPRLRVGAQVPETVATRFQGESFRTLAEAITRSREVAPGQLVDVDLLTGPPALAVTQAGAGALMLVVGARGSGGFAAMLLGSVSRYAAMQARCPVVVIREETSAVHREVVVGIRDPRDADATLGYAFDEAALRGATLVAVHSWTWSHSGPSDHPGSGDATGQFADAERMTAEAELNVSEALRTWRDKYPAVPVWQDVVHDHPAHVLAIYSARADLVVIGRHDGTGSRTAIGGIQHALLHHARGPVAIVPAAD
jgi:nucleotide-binding universal stress UspA family protein